MKTILFLLAAPLLFVGCAKTPPLVVGPDHPANADAAEAPLPPASHTLAISDASATQPATADRGGHQMGQHQMSSPTAGAAAATYVCPMHPEVTSTAPGKCPKCKMNLVKKEVRR